MFKQTIGQTISARNITNSAKFPALFLGATKYAQASTNSSLDNFTAFTMMHSFNHTNATYSGSGASHFFNILKNDNSSIFLDSGSTAGAAMQPYGFNNYAIVSKGSSKSMLTVARQRATITSSVGRRGNSIITHALTGDASSNTVVWHTIVSSGMQAGDNDVDVHVKSTHSYTFTNWGALGTDGYINIGAYRQAGAAMDTSNANLDQGHGFLRAQLWDSVLTDQQILNTVGGDGTVFSMPSYSEGNYPQPLHEWIPVLGNNLQLLDTGSATAINLTIHGLAKVGYFLNRT